VNPLPKAIVVGLVWGGLQALLIVAAVYEGSLIPRVVHFANGGPTGTIVNYPNVLDTRDTIDFSHGLPGYLAIGLMVVLAFVSGYALADWGSTVGAWFLSQIVGFLIDVGLLIVSASPISSLSGSLQIFFLFTHVIYFLLGMIPCLIGAFFGERRGGRPRYTPIGEFRGLRKAGQRRD
jgi:hypothetical protein